MTRRVQRLQPQLADDQHFAVVQPQVDKGRRAGAVHDHRHVQLARQLLGGREMVRMGMGVDQIADAQAIPRGQRADSGRSGSSSGSISAAAQDLLAADQIGAAAPGSHCFQNHGNSVSELTQLPLPATALARLPHRRSRGKCGRPSGEAPPRTGSYQCARRPASRAATCAYEPARGRVRLPDDRFFGAGRLIG